MLRAEEGVDLGSRPDVSRRFAGALLAISLPVTCGCSERIAAPRFEPSAPAVVSGALHPLIAGMPNTAEASVRAVGAYIRDHAVTPLDRARAVHDWIADRIAYDSAAVAPMGDSGPDWVFVQRRGDCGGVARLFVELARAAGLDARVIVGLALDHGVLGIHAWNEVRIGGRYESIDVAWDAGYVDEAFAFHKRYSVEYFLPSREVFRRDHTRALTLSETELRTRYRLRLGTPDLDVDCRGCPAV